REDLFQRLSVAVLRIPPLRERADDAVVLGRAFLADSVRRYGAAPRTLSPDAERTIRAYGWPGNVRELANAMERVVLFCDAECGELDALGLAATRSAGGRVAVAPTGEVQIDFPDGGLALEAVERALIVAALAKA